MKGHIFEIKDEADSYLYWCVVELEEEIIKTAYRNYISSDFAEFEDFWNSQNSLIQIERVYLTEIYV